MFSAVKTAGGQPESPVQLPKPNNLNENHKIINKDTKCRYLSQTTWVSPSPRLERRPISCQTRSEKRHMADALLQDYENLTASRRNSSSGNILKGEIFQFRNGKQLHLRCGLACDLHRSAGEMRWVRLESKKIKNYTASLLIELGEPLVHAGGAGAALDLLMENS